jgi:dienelactone hydrolase
MNNRASEDTFDILHKLVTDEFVARIKSGEATTADLRAATDWLDKNDVTGVAIQGSPLSSLAGLIPELTFEDVNG